VGILPARRGQIQLLIAGVAVFAPAAVAAFLFTALVVCLLGSSTAVVDKQIVIVWRHGGGSSWRGESVARGQGAELVGSRRHTLTFVSVAPSTF
jgi:hypothetical protein